MRSHSIITMIFHNVSHIKTPPKIILVNEKDGNTIIPWELKWIINPKYYKADPCKLNWDRIYSQQTNKNSNSIDLINIY